MAPASLSEPPSPPLAPLLPLEPPLLVDPLLLEPLLPVETPPLLDPAPLVPPLPPDALELELPPPLDPASPPLVPRFDPFPPQLQTHATSSKARMDRRVAFVRTERPGRPSPRKDDWVPMGFVLPNQ
jgi:hypothetical protein